MEVFKIENLTFKYPLSERAALNDISFTVNQGEFITVCGKSGSGKSTLLRQFAPAHTPNGERSGNVYFLGNDVYKTDLRSQCQGIGFVTQNPDNQLVTDKVWHELSFGLESLGMSTPEIRAKVSEMASFFGIQTWFHKNVNELSGGQKQLLNLASVMVMRPEVLILDEPLSQLDPIGAQDFMNMLGKLNNELGLTVIMTEHSLGGAFELSDRVMVLDKGGIIADDTPKQVGKILFGHDMFCAMPSPMRMYALMDGSNEYPVTVREGREFLSKTECVPKPIKKAAVTEHRETPAVELRHVYFRYEKKLDDILKDFNMKAYAGEIYALVGGNGAGKTTALNIIGGLIKPYRGNVLVNGKKTDLNCGCIGIMPQDPKLMFVKKTAAADLYDICGNEKAVADAAEICGLTDILERHPYDLSGGEQQKLALAKLLLLNPEILLLDEPTKGMDAHFKTEFASILTGLKKSGTAIIMVSHDVEFCAEYADRCAFVFDGSITSEGTAHEFFADKYFYTTDVNRMSRGIVEGAVTENDILTAFGKDVLKKEFEEIKFHLPSEEKQKTKHGIKIKTVLGIIFALIFLAVLFLTRGGYEEAWKTNLSQLITIALAGLSLACLIPKKLFAKLSVIPDVKRKTSVKSMIVSAAVIAVIVPITIYIGFRFFDNRKYYFISMLIILEAILPPLLSLEKRRISARELVLISVICAAAVAGRSAFYMLPQFKPMAAIVIIAGVSLGGETGFLIGVISAFVSNMFFGQGAWTVWQMFAFGLVGFFSGVIFRALPVTRASLCLYGFAAVTALYGIIMNISSVVLYQSEPNLSMFIASEAMGLPFDLIHAAATVFFLYFAAPPVLEKLERVKTKYGMDK